MKKIAVIGGGITGLAVAHGLAKLGLEVTVFEKERETGGLAAVFMSGPVAIDRYYRHIFTAHTELLDVIRTLGLEDRLVFKRARMAYFSQGRIYPLDTATDLLRFAPLPIAARLRVGISASAFVLRKRWQDFDGISAADWLVKRCGRRGYGLFWEPLLKNKFGDRAAVVSAAWLWDRLQSRTRGRIGRSSGSLGYLRGGFRPLCERLEAEIVVRGGRIVTQQAITAIERSAEPRQGWILNGDARSPYAACIATVPLPQFTGLSPSLPPEYIARLAGIAYSHSVCMVLRLRVPLSPYYWINVGDEDFPFAVVVEHTNWMGCDEYGGQHVVYLSRYCAGEDDAAWNSTDAKLIAEYGRYLKKMFPGFHESQVLGVHVHRDRHTQPIFHTGFASLRPAFATPLADLFLVNTSQFYPLSRCMNTSFILAREFISYWRGKETRP